MLCDLHAKIYLRIWTRTAIFSMAPILRSVAVMDMAIGGWRARRGGESGKMWVSLGLDVCFFLMLNPFLAYVLVVVVVVVVVVVG